MRWDESFNTVQLCQALGWWLLRVPEAGSDGGDHGTIIRILQETDLDGRPHVKAKKQLRY